MTPPPSPSPDTLLALENTQNEATRLEAARCLGTLSAHLGEDELKSLLLKVSRPVLTCRAFTTAVITSVLRHRGSLAVYGR